MNDDESSSIQPPGRAREFTNADLEQVRQSLEGLLYGSVSIVVQDGVIVQIDRTEKRRLRGNGQRNTPANNR